MSLPRVSLQALDAFERVAQSGSMQVAAREMGLSISSVSHQIARLEEQLGATLFDRSSRPFTLTREGAQAAQHLSKGLIHLRRATSETVISGLLGTRSLRLGIVEDFESSVTPELAVILARQMPHAALSIGNILSHEADDMLRRGGIDVAVSSNIAGRSTGVSSLKLVHDPFVMALPKDLDVVPAGLLKGSDLPFIRFSGRHLIGKQVEAHLARNRIDLANRFSFDSVQSMMAVIAGGEGWAVVTPIGFMRAQRFADRVRLHPLPIAAFARTLTVSARADFDDQTLQAITGLLRQIVRREAVEPACAMYPWLSEQFTVLGEGD
ncbi:DNA-binding transcriptional regulator, LysR family [Monaibacterium marinum]|uniref:DNA-binding transcriptional regulator, LysR family n=1 Tax=Pontivivens marinum TaxID=1690039 RepID=A0A2C9CLJ3_9RHOB|nr:LysR family transcriptional regulator [Monaibacterium marinum]SOH92216.1 DNA-binding transcriptional regulator, LysR family [Monaibacterium marinum]